MDMMFLTLLLSAHSHSCFASLVDVTVLPTGIRGREKERASWKKFCRLLLTGSTLINITTPFKLLETQQLQPHVDSHMAKPMQCNFYSIVKSPSLTLSFSSIPARWPCSFFWVVMEMANKAITFTNFLRDRCWHND